MSGQTPLSARTLRSILIGSVATLGAAACGSRGPLDDYPLTVLNDASATLDGAQLTDASVDSPRDVSPIEKAVLCADCLSTKCGDTFTQCLSDVACRDGFQCILQNCVAAGKTDVGCFSSCANGDFAKLAKLFLVVQCPLSQCAAECPDLLGALGGLGGQGGGGTPGKPALASREPVCTTLRDSYAPWPTVVPPRCEAR